MPSPLIKGALIGAGAALADGPLKDAFHSHHDMFDITWVDYVVIVGAIFLSHKYTGHWYYALAGFLATYFVSGKIRQANAVRPSPILQRVG